MDSTHAAVGTGGVIGGGALVGLISQTWHLDPNLVSNWLTVVGSFGASLGLLIVWFLKWKYPDVPPLPFAAAAEPPAVPAPAPPAVPPDTGRIG